MLSGVEQGRDDAKNKTASKSFKIAVVGNRNVGKSCFISRICDDRFHRSYLPTSGLKRLLLTLNKNLSRLSLDIWDGIGQKGYESAFSRTQAVIIVTKVIDTSLTPISHWYDMVLKYLPDPNNQNLCGVPLVVCFNMNDLLTEGNKSTNSLIVDFLKERNIVSFDISSKTGHNITEPVNYLAKILQQDYDRKMIAFNPSPKSLPLSPSPIPPIEILPGIVEIAMDNIQIVLPEMKEHRFVRESRSFSFGHNFDRVNEGFYVNDEIEECESFLRKLERSYHDGSLSMKKIRRLNSVLEENIVETPIEASCEKRIIPYQRRNSMDVLFQYIPKFSGFHRVLYPTVCIYLIRIILLKRQSQ